MAVGADQEEWEKNKKQKRTGFCLMVSFHGTLSMSRKCYKYFIYLEMCLICLHNAKAETCFLVKVLFQLRNIL